MALYDCITYKVHPKADSDSISPDVALIFVVFELADGILHWVSLGAAVVKYDVSDCGTAM